MWRKAVSLWAARKVVLLSLSQQCYIINQNFICIRIMGSLEVEMRSQIIINGAKVAATGKEIRISWIGGPLLRTEWWVTQPPPPPTGL